MNFKLQANTNTRMAYKSWGAYMLVGNHYPGPKVTVKPLFFSKVF